MMDKTRTDANKITDAVRKQYASVASSALTNKTQGVQAVAEAFGYSAEELRGLPAEANMGLSCGNPVATAHLKPGETVLDLGCGGGLDVLLASRKIGPEGRAIGIDMTDEMLERARANAQKAGADNVEFHKATIDNLPLPDASVDCIISNCVINLAPDKHAVFREMARVLKPGGRVAVSDIALKRPLPPEIGDDLLAYVGCISGAISVEAYRAGLEAAGFAPVEMVDTGADLNAYSQIEGQTGCCGGETAASSTTEPSSSCAPTEVVALGASSPSSADDHDTPASNDPELYARLKELAERYDLNNYAASVKIFAVKA